MWCKRRVLDDENDKKRYGGYYEACQSINIRSSQNHLVIAIGKTKHGASSPDDNGNSEILSQHCVDAVP